MRRLEGERLQAEGLLCAKVLRRQQVWVECLPGMHETLGSIPYITPQK